MRTLSILTAAALGLAASCGLASAQATNVAPISGTAKALYGNGTSEMWDARAQARRHEIRRSRAVRPAPRVYYGPAHTMSPAMYHAGDPQYWR